MDTKNKTTIKEKFIADFKKEWKGWKFKLLLAASVILFLALTLCRENKLVITLSLGLWVIAYILCEFLRKEKDIFQKLYTSYILILNLIFFGLYISFVFFKINIVSILFLIIAIGFIFLLTALYSLFFLKITKRNIYALVANYLYLVFVTVILFGYVFAFFSAFNGQGIVDYKTDSKITELWNYIYFSSTTFYSTTFGDLIPSGWMIKLISQIEVVVSAVIHVIILGDLLSRRLDSQKNKNG